MTQIQARDERTPKGNGRLRGIEAGLGRLLSWPIGKGNGATLSSFVGWRPACNVTETDDGYCIEVELPEMRKDQLQITLGADTLTVKGERTRRAPSKRTQDLRVECTYGAFQRSFDLPSDADRSAIEASFADGMLTLEIAKMRSNERLAPREIPIG